MLSINMPEMEHLVVTSCPPPPASSASTEPPGATGGGCSRRCERARSRFRCEYACGKAIMARKKCACGSSIEAVVLNGSLELGRHLVGLPLVASEAAGYRCTRQGLRKRMAAQLTRQARKCLASQCRTIASGTSKRQACPARSTARHARRQAAYLAWQGDDPELPNLGQAARRHALDHHPIGLAAGTGVGYNADQLQEQGQGAGGSGVWPPAAQAPAWKPSVRQQRQQRAVAEQGRRRGADGPTWLLVVSSHVVWLLQVVTLPARYGGGYGYARTP